MMLILFLAIWLSAAIILITDPKDESMRLMSAALFCTGCGALGVLVQEKIPSLASISPLLYILGPGLVGILFSLALNWGPYQFLMFGLSYSGLLDAGKTVTKYRIKWVVVKCVAAIPPVLMNCIYPFIPAYEPSSVFLAFWVVPYCLLSAAFMVAAYFNEKDVKAKRQRQMTLFTVTPLMLFSLVANYILPVFGVKEVWRYSPWLTIFFFVFMFMSAKFGFMGVKVEKDYLYSTRVMTSGISILSHTLNNGLSKIKIKAEEILESDGDNPEDARHILSSVDHLFGMLDKIKNRMRDLAFEDRLVCLNDLIDEVVPMVDSFCDRKEIAIRRHFTHRVEVMGDPVHLKELLVNICKNGIEAIKSRGLLVIDLSVKRNRTVITVKDTGSGISREKIAHVGEPFWTTKDSNRNYGLGLWYCNKVMDRYGKMELLSVEGQGTTVNLHFSPIKLVSAQALPDSSEVVHEPNQSIGG